MIDPSTPQLQSAGSSRARGGRTGLAVAVVATALTVGGTAWPAFFGAEPSPLSHVTLQAASPALVNGGPVATSYADLVQTVSPAVVAVHSSRMVQQTSMGADNPLRRFRSPSLNFISAHRIELHGLQADVTHDRNAGIDEEL